MKQTERRFSSSNQNSVSKVLADINERKLQSRQQEILNIVKNSSCDGIRKLNLLKTKAVKLSPSYTNASINSFKDKQKPKSIQKETSKSSLRSRDSSSSSQSNLHISKETYNWIDKHFLHCSYIKESKLKEVPTNTKYNIIIKNEDLLNELTKINNDLEEKKLKITQKEIIGQTIQKAIKANKIFLIRGDIPYLDKSLENRGWLKKFESPKTRHLPYGSVPSLDDACLGNVYHPDDTLNEKAFIFQELKNIQPNFIWDCRNDFISWKSNIKPETYLNRLQKSSVYTSKIGLNIILEKSYWFFEEGISEVSFPRCYNANEEKNIFINDYRNTAAVSFLKWFVQLVEQNNESLNISNCHLIFKRLDFAKSRCEDILRIANDEELDCEIQSVSKDDWDEFIEDYIKIVLEENFNFLENTSEAENLHFLEYYTECTSILNDIKQYDSQYELNGFRNIWILKPNLLCCGKGIIMTHDLNAILSKIDDSPEKHFLIQKYIEKPLLVKNTKFDVRHWFLVTKSYPLTIWIYKESLLRFSSRPFTFDDYHEIVHICNTAVQNKYTDQKNPVKSLNWDCEMLNEYLKNEFSDLDNNPWYNIIYPKMCEGIVSVMLTAQDYIDTRENSFELYGADFLIMDDLSVWLIEINTNPRMNPPSSKLTARLYPDVLESLLKVVLEYPFDENVDTGNFVQIYKQEDIVCQKLDIDSELFIKGNAISKKAILFLDTEFEELQLM